MRRHRTVIVLLLAATVGLGACSEEARDELGAAIGGGATEQDDGTAPPPDAGASLPDDGAEEPEAPAEPEEPAEPAEPVAPEAGGDDTADDAEAASAVVLALVLLTVVVVAVVLRRRAPAGPAGGQPATAARSRAYWRSRARAVYADARWVHDHLDESTVAWRAGQLVAPDAVDPADARARDWHEAQGRTAAVLDQLYALEADAPGLDERAAVQQVARAVREVDGAARVLVERQRQEALERVRTGAVDVAHEVVIDLDPIEAHRLVAARGVLARSLASLQVLLVDD